MSSSGPKNPAAAPRRAIIYDLDGTLADAFDDIADALNAGLADCGLPGHPAERVRQFVGNGIEMLVRRALAPDAQHRLAEVLPRVKARYEANPGAGTRLYPGALEALGALNHAGVAQAILTNKPHEIALALCARTGLAAVVDRVLGDAPGRALKPDPAAALLVLRELGAAPSTAAVVGDGIPDAELARNIGCRFLACPWGATPREVLARLAPDHMLESLADLPRLVLG